MSDFTLGACGRTAAFTGPATQVCALPERAPKALLKDKGYDVDAIRADLASVNIQAVIPGRSNRRIKIDHDRAHNKQRNHIERSFWNLKNNRASATRYDHLAESFLDMVHGRTSNKGESLPEYGWRGTARLGSTD